MPDVVELVGSAQLDSCQRERALQDGPVDGLAAANEADRRSLDMAVHTEHKLALLKVPRLVLLLSTVRRMQTLLDQTVLSRGCQECQGYLGYCSTSFSRVEAKKMSTGNIFQESVLCNKVIWSRFKCQKMHDFWQVSL